MTPDSVLLVGILCAVVLLLTFELVRPDLVAWSTAVVLIATGLVSAEEGLSGFSSPATLTVLAMFLLSAGLVRTGVADHLAGLLVRLGGRTGGGLTVAVMLLSASMSAFMNNVGATAILLPAVLAVAREAHYPASRLLMPLSFGSLLGGLTTLIGTPPNLLSSLALERAGYQPFRLFDFFPTGAILLGSGVAYMVFLGRHLIPVRAIGVGEKFGLDGYVTEVVIPSGSPWAGKTLAAVELPSRYGLSVLQIRRKLQGPGGGDLEEIEWPRPSTVLSEGDRLLVEGEVGSLVEDRPGSPLRLLAAAKFEAAEFTSGEVELAEVALAPTSRFLGRSINEGQLRQRYDVLALAVRRRGKPIRAGFTQVPLAVGDVLLVQGRAAALERLAASPDFLITHRLRHAPRLSARAPLAVAILVGTLAVATAGWLPIAASALGGALLMILTGCLRAEEVYREVDWKVVFLIAGMMPLGIALDAEHTGLAAQLAAGLTRGLEDLGPLGVLGGLFLMTTLLTEVMSNAAAAVLLSPIAIAAAEGIGASPYPFVMAVAIGASTSFLTPIGHQNNLLIYGLGGFRFSDFPRVGAPLNALVLVLVLLFLPRIWPF